MRTTRISIVVTFVLLFAGWSLAAYWLRPEQEGALVLLPGPLKVVESLGTMLTERNFAVDILQSVKRIALGLLAAMVPAFGLGIWFGVSPRIYRAFDPLFSFAKYLPPVAFIPILILWLGIGLQQQVALLFIGVFFTLTVDIAETVSNTPLQFSHAALTLGARPRQLVWRVMIPYSLPDFIGRLRGMIAIAWTYLIVAEIVAAEDGIGRVIINSQRYLQTDRVLAGLLTIGILGILFDKTLQGLSWLLCKWKRL